MPQEFVRARRPGETASLFLPSVPTLLRYAAEMEAERDHVLSRAGADDPFAPEDALLAEALRSRTEPGLDEVAFEALEASAAFDRVLYDGAEFGTGAHPDEELDFLGLPGLLEPDQVAALLRQRQAAQLAAQRAAQRDARRRQRAEPDPPDPTPLPTHERIAALRRELSALVAAHHHRTGKPHGVIHSELRRTCGGPPAAQATEAHLTARIEALRRWSVTR